MDLLTLSCHSELLTIARDHGDMVFKPLPLCPFRSSVLVLVFDIVLYLDLLFVEFRSISSQLNRCFFSVFHFLDVFTLIHNLFFKKNKLILFGINFNVIQQLSSLTNQVDISEEYHAYTHLHH